MIVVPVVVRDAVARKDVMGESQDNGCNARLETEEGKRGGTLTQSRLSGDLSGSEVPTLLSLP